MTTLVVYTPKVSARLFYILDWVFKERLEIEYRLTQDPQSGVDISYGLLIEGIICVPDMGLLWEQMEGRERLSMVGEFRVGDWDGLRTFFHHSGGGYRVPFDLFSAVFWLLSRHEEYMPYEADQHGRYPATESLLFKNDMLSMPIIDQWLFKLRGLLVSHLNVSMCGLRYSFTPSYDIDIAYSYLGKGLRRTAGGYLRSLVHGNINQIAERSLVLAGKQVDPYDSFGWLQEVHLANDLTPLYFVLCALKTTPYDKNINPRHHVMTALIGRWRGEGEIGIHPSYYANVNNGLQNELRVLKDICGGRKIGISRQHYIKLLLPNTCRLLLEAGITDDFSMGYSTQFGFRAGTGSSFLWYDLENECVTSLRLHPFCFMDTTGLYDLKISRDEAFRALRVMMDELKRVGSTLITVFHNFSLGTASEWEGWSEAYRQFVASAAQK